MNIAGTIICNKLAQEFIKEGNSERHEEFLNNVSWILDKGYKNKMKDNKNNDKHLREYYEIGCLCVSTNKIKKFEGPDDTLAVDYYEENCHCSRHTNSANRDCWDRK